MDEQQSQINYNRTPVYYQEQIDQLILTPDARSNVITKKEPKFVYEPIFTRDSDGQLVIERDENGEPIFNEYGEPKFKISGYTKVQKGWESVSEQIPSSELFLVDNATSNISHEAVILLLRLMWWHNRLSTYQSTTDEDYSLYLHNIRNDGLAVLQSAKSYNGGTIQAIKTFINKTDTKQWSQQPDEKKQSFFTQLLGGKKKKDDEQKYTAFEKI